MTVVSITTRRPIVHNDRDRYGPLVDEIHADTERLRSEPGNFARGLLIGLAISIPLYALIGLFARAVWAAAHLPPSG